MDQGNENKRMDEAEYLLYQNLSKHIEEIYRPDHFKNSANDQLVQQFLQVLKNAVIIVTDQIGNYTVPANFLAAVPVDFENAYSELAIVINKQTSEAITKGDKRFMPSDEQLITFAKQTIDLKLKIPPEDILPRTQLGKINLNNATPAKTVFEYQDEQYQPALPTLRIIQTQINPFPERLNIIEKN